MSYSKLNLHILNIARVRSNKTLIQIQSVDFLTAEEGNLEHKFDYLLKNEGLTKVFSNKG